MQPLTTAVSKGVNLSLGMLNLVVSVHAAVGEDKSSALKIVCTSGHDATPIKMKSFCPTCANEDTASFQRARPIGDGLVVIPQDVIDADKDANKAFAKAIALTVHPVNEVTSVLLPSGKSYYLAMVQPVAGALNTYTLLSRLVSSRTDLAFMTKLTLRSATTLYQLTTAGEGTLVLRQMADAELVREHPAIVFSDLEDKAIDLAGMLADSLIQPFVTTTHGTGRSQIIAEYALGQTPVIAGAIANQTAPDLATVTDFTAHLAALVKANQKSAPKKRATRAARKPSQKVAS